MNIISILNHAYKPGAWLSVLFVFSLSGCASRTVAYSFEDTYQEYSNQNCSFDYVAAFKTMAENNIGVSQRRRDIDFALNRFIRSLPPVRNDLNSSCFFETLVTVGVPFYGKAPTYFPVYYELWISSNSDTRQMEVCAGANPIRSDEPLLEGTGSNHGIKTPDGYKSGYANTLRHLPICAVQRVD